MRYLVMGSEGPGFGSSEEAIEVLEKGILPPFDFLMPFVRKHTNVSGWYSVLARTATHRTP